MIDQVFTGLVLLGIGGLAGFTYRQSNRLTRVETLTEALLNAVTQLAEKLNSVVVVPK